MPQFQDFKGKTPPKEDEPKTSQAKNGLLDVDLPGLGGHISYAQGSFLASCSKITHGSAQGSMLDVKGQISASHIPGKCLTQCTLSNPFGQSL